MNKEIFLVIATYEPENDYMWAEEAVSLYGKEVLTWRETREEAEQLINEIMADDNRKRNLKSLRCTLEIESVIRGTLKEAEVRIIDDLCLWEEEPDEDAEAE